MIFTSCLCVCFFALFFKYEGILEELVVFTINFGLNTFELCV